MLCSFTLWNKLEDRWCKDFENYLAKIELVSRERFYSKYRKTKSKQSRMVRVWRK